MIYYIKYNHNIVSNYINNIIQYETISTKYRDKNTHNRNKPLLWTRLSEYSNIRGHEHTFYLSCGGTQHFYGGSTYRHGPNCRVANSNEYSVVFICQFSLAAALSIGGGLMRLDCTMIGKFNTVYKAQYHSFSVKTL